MKPINMLFTLLCLCVILPIGCAKETDAPDETVWKTSTANELNVFKLGNTRNPQRLGDIVFAGQPDEGDIQIIADLGFKTVINLRPLGESPNWDEEKMITDAGITFIRIPYGNASELTDSVFDRTRKQLRTAERPILLHCASGNRVGAVWIPYRVLDEGISLEQALSEAKKIGMRNKDYGKLAEAYIKNNQ